MSINQQTKMLYEDLEKVSGVVSWRIGKLANALLEQAKSDHPDNVALAALDPFTQGNGGHIKGLSGPQVRALVGQIVAATKTAPAIA
jgi:hypothetical protein